MEFMVCFSQVCLFTDEVVYILIAVCLLYCVCGAGRIDSGCTSMLALLLHGHVSSFQSRTGQYLTVNSICFRSTCTLCHHVLMRIGDEQCDPHTSKNFPSQPRRLGGGASFYTVHGGGRRQLGQWRRTAGRRAAALFSVRRQPWGQTVRPGLGRDPQSSPSYCPTGPDTRPGQRRKVTAPACPPVSWRWSERGTTPAGPSESGGPHQPESPWTSWASLVWRSSSTQVRHIPSGINYDHCLHQTIGKAFRFRWLTPNTLGTDL